MDVFSVGHALDARPSSRQDAGSSGPSESSVDKFPSRERQTAAALAPRVSAVVVVGKAAAGGGGQAPLDLCLRSALAEAWIDDLVIVDHGCPPRVASALRALQADRRDVQLVTVKPRLSLAAAANVGAGYACARWLLFLDPLVVLQRGAVERMTAAGAGVRGPWIVGGRLTDMGGREQHGARSGALNAWSAIAIAMDLRGMPRVHPDAPARVAAVSGAFMLVPRADFEALGGFDVSFATDAADLDLCRRASWAGGSVLFEPAASGVQFARGPRRGRKQAQGLALLAAKCARTPLQRGFALIAGPAMAVLLWLRDFVAGRPPVRPERALRR